MSSATGPATGEREQAESPEDWSGVDGCPLLPLVETARGLVGAPAMLAVAGVVRPAFGNIDLAAELGVDPQDQQALLMARSSLVVAAAAAGCAPPVDGVTTNFQDPAVVAQDVRAARRLGMTAKRCIHPSRCRPCRTSSARPGRRRPGLAGSSRRPATGAVAVDGYMVDAPVLARARHILDRVQSGPVPTSSNPSVPGGAA